MFQSEMSSEQIALYGWCEVEIRVCIKVEWVENGNVPEDKARYKGRVYPGIADCRATSCYSGVCC